MNKYNASSRPVLSFLAKLQPGDRRNKQAPPCPHSTLCDHHVCVGMCRLGLKALGRAGPGPDILKPWLRAQLRILEAWAESSSPGFTQSLLGVDQMNLRLCSVHKHDLQCTESLIWFYCDVLRQYLPFMAVIEIINIIFWDHQPLPLRLRKHMNLHSQRTICSPYMTKVIHD